MSEVLFYHLTESTLQDALPGLLERSLGRGWRAVVQTGTEERRDALDAHLWSFRDDSFLAHGTDRDPQIRFLVDGAVPPDLSAYERAVFLFDGHDAVQVEAAREHWKAVKAGGHAVTYWQQTPDRRWERKA